MALAAIPQPADLGLLRFDLRHGFVDVLVRGSHPGLGDAPRSLRPEAMNIYGMLRHGWRGPASLASAYIPA